MGQAGHRPLEELALAGHLGDLGLRLGDDAAPGAGGVGLAGPDEPGQPMEPPGGDPEPDHGDANAQNDPDRHECSLALRYVELAVAECERHLG